MLTVIVVLAGWVIVGGVVALAFCRMAGSTQDDAQ